MLTYHLFVSFSILFPLIAFGQRFGLENPIEVNSITELIAIVVKVIRYIAIPFVVIMIMYAGFLFLYNAVMEKGGDNQKDAKNVLFWVVIGAFVVLSAEMIAWVIDGTLKGLR